MTNAPSMLTELNPIWIRGFRERCRLKHMLSWGTIWITLASFVFLVTYITMVEQDVSTKADAAKAALPAILVIQAIILMLFGTGAVASGISQDRDDELLNYIRMTPMSPTAKAIGYLFGLPAREYLLFALTMPLVVIIVAISGFSLLTLAHFYLVFFTSVIVYHMTALVVGMVSPKPRLSSLMSMGLVLLLYFALPNLSRIGITFFEFLTIRPTFFGLIQQELPPELRGRVEASGIDTFRPVPFFNTAVKPTLYTLMVQGFLIATMFSIVHRKWRDQASHLFSKPGALAVFCGVSLFTFASLWAIVAQDEAYSRLFETIGRTGPIERIPETFFFLMLICIMIVSCTYLFLICAVTPSKNLTLTGIRQQKRSGESRFSRFSDAASSLPVALVMIAICLTCVWMILSLASKHGDYMSSAPTPASVLAVFMLIAGIGLFIQGAAESTSMRVFGVCAFLFWMIPFFTMIIMFTGFEAFEPGLYVGQPFPPTSIGFSLAWMLETTAPPETHSEGFRFLPPDDGLTNTPGRIAYTGAIGYMTAAVAVQMYRLHRRRSLWRS